MFFKLFVLLLIVFTSLNSTSFAWMKIKTPEEQFQQLRFGQALEEKLNPNQISLLVWNIFKGNKEDWSSDLKSLSHNKDLILLQEMLLNKKMKSVLEEFTNYQFDGAISFLYESENIPTGVITASRAKPFVSKAFISKVKEPILRTPKTGMVSKYSLEGRNDTLLVINIHAINFVSLKSFSSQLDEYSSILKLHNGPIIFAGDFNTWSKERLNYLQNYMSEYDLKAIDFLDDDRLKFLGNPLDFIYVRGLDYSFARVRTDREGSDHKALTVDLRVNFLDRTDDLN
ncbi:endonuclease/exonuclease/phosphatase family protein [Halobacteriovorax sp. GB3]|uniref:endonuclease/exonuclease/phosphatase family protein n=1 Tax=Halobacteriovorax sp. GB3 TaxID=2719615 RepID=UPI00235E9696|nr:endonuclease/exonuclease/phosphatase family protein [Halobacteriovorax sp. GB3]MDD0853901.1 endonuclease/exonuclease/phosphatase family protein [Halobacteriovorax sp. GB3]